MATIAVLGTLDTNGEEHAYIAECIRARGHETTLIDVGTFAPPTVEPDISRELVAAVSAIDINTPIQRGDREECISVMAIASAALLLQLYSDRKIDGVISMGGVSGTKIGTAAMRTLPLGFPKVMVTTLASGNTRQYVGTSDIVMFPSIVDIAGLNSISRTICTRAAGAICGMAEAKIEQSETDRPIIAASISDNTTECVNAARDIIEAAGYEVLVFQANGNGGRSMESLIESGMISGVLDITTTELADEIAGGTLTAGPSRLEAAAKAGIPAVIAPGCTDIVNFGAPDTIPKQYLDRKLFVQNPELTLMRSNTQEAANIGKTLADKANAYTGPVTMMLPLKGVSALGNEGEQFFDPSADTALFESIKQHVKPKVSVQEIDAEINHSDFSLACAVALLDMLKTGK